MDFAKDFQVKPRFKLRPYSSNISPHPIIDLFFRNLGLSQYFSECFIFSLGTSTPILYVISFYSS